MPNPPVQLKAEVSSAQSVFAPALIAALVARPCPLGRVYPPGHLMLKDRDAANQAYFAAVRRWHVCPVKKNSRVTYKSEKNHGTPWGATDRVAQVQSDFREWPNADVGVALGPSRLIVIEVDTPKGRADQSRDGFASLAALEAAHGPLHATHTATSPRGGLHHWYLAPPGVHVTHKELAPGVEVLGEGSMVVIPPARGRVWIDRPRGELTELPEAWIELVRDEEYEPPPAAKRNIPDDIVIWTPPPGIADWRLDVGRGHDIPDDERLKCHVALKFLSADCSENDWFIYGCCIYDSFPNDIGFELFHLWSQRARWKYKGSKDCEDKWDNIGKGKRKLLGSGKRTRTLATIFDDATAVDPRWWDTYETLLRKRARESVS
jgi:hypothetical protein